MASEYAKGTRVWIPDSSIGWVPGTIASVTLPEDQTPSASVTLVVSIDGQEDATKSFKVPLSVLESAGNDINPITPPPGQDPLPPLRNPPLLESAEDLASLSNLNEPSGKSSRKSEHVVSS